MNNTEQIIVPDVGNKRAHTWKKKQPTMFIFLGI